MNSRVWRAIELIVFEVGALRMLIKDPCARLNEVVRSASQSMKWLKIRNGVQLSVPASNVRKLRNTHYSPIDGLYVRRGLYGPINRGET